MTAESGSSSSFSSTASAVNPSTATRPSYQPPPPHQHSASVDGSPYAAPAMTSSLISNGSPASSSTTNGRSLVHSGNTSGSSAGTVLNHQLTSSTYSNGRCSPSVFGGRTMTGSKQGDVSSSLKFFSCSAKCCMQH
jgi:hypothetical protein